MPIDVATIVILGLTAASMLAWGVELVAPALSTTSLLRSPPKAPLRLPGLVSLLGTSLCGLAAATSAVAILQMARSGPPRALHPLDADRVIDDIRSQILLNGAIVGVLLSLWWGDRKPGFRLWPDNPAQTVMDALTGFLLAIGPVFVVLVATMQLGLREEQVYHPLLRLLDEAGSFRTWLWVGFSAIVVAPITEELLFRVILQTTLERVLPTLHAIVCSSLVFCLVHPFPDSLALLPLSAVLGAVYVRRRCYWTLVLIHALFNALNLMLSALT